MKRVLNTHGLKAIVMCLLVGLTLGITACERHQGPAERAGEKIDQAVDDMGDAIDDAADDIEDATDG